MKTLRLLLIVFLIQAGRCAEEDLDRSRTRRASYQSGADTNKNIENLERYQTEIENYAVYKPLNSLLLEVTRCQEVWNSLNATMQKSKSKLIVNNIDFGNFGTVNLGYGCEGDLRTEEIAKLIEISNYALKKLSSPIDDFSQNINDTLNHFKPQLLVFKELMTFRLEFCEANELESCKEKIVKWSEEEIEKFKTILNDIKLNINEGVKVVQKVSDDLRKYKHGFRNYLQERKKVFECCRLKSLFDIDLSCGHMKKFEFKPLEFNVKNTTESAVDDTTAKTPNSI